MKGPSFSRLFDRCAHVSWTHSPCPLQSTSTTTWLVFLLEQPSSAYDDADASILVLDTSCRSLDDDTAVFSSTTAQLPTSTPPPQGPATPQRFSTTSPKSSTQCTPPSVSKINQGYQVRPCEIPPVMSWKPDVDFHDTMKVNGLDFPSTIRSSKFSQYKDIEGMDVPLSKFLYQGLNNN